MAWKLLSDDAKQALRIRRFFMAALSYLIWIGITFYCYALGLVDVPPQTFGLLIAISFLVNVLFYVVLRSGLNRYWPDPSLTLPQMLVATFWVMLLMMYAPKVRGTLLWLAFFGSYVGRLREIVSRRNAELAQALRQNRELAIHDDLTGSYNRR